MYCSIPYSDNSIPVLYYVSTEYVDLCEALMQARYNISLRIYSYWNESVVGELEFPVIVAGDPIPEIRIFGPPEVEILLSEPLKLAGQGEAAGCNDNFNVVRYDRALQPTPFRDVLSYSVSYKL